jgi:hypothetical protein
MVCVLERNVIYCLLVIVLERPVYLNFCTVFLWVAYKHVLRRPGYMHTHPGRKFNSGSVSLEIQLRHYLLLTWGRTVGVSVDWRPSKVTLIGISMVAKGINTAAIGLARL